MGDLVRDGGGPKRRAVLVALTGALAGALPGCARIPSAGPVRQGDLVAEEDEPGYRVEPVGPVDGASPEEVVRGFLLAGVGVDDDFRAARDFLAARRRASWRPTARTVVHPQSTLQVAVVDGGGVGAAGSADGPVEVRVTTAVTANVDPTGRYRAAVPGELLDAVLTLVRDGGQWRITDAPDLLLLDDSRFSRTFAPRSVVFSARGSGRLVPDPRWLLDRASTATTLVQQVFAGPPSWLAPAVTTGVPAGTELPAGSVSVSDGVASVDLPPALQRQSTAALRQLQQQLVATLRGLGTAASVVQVSLDGGDLAPTATPPLDSGGGDGVPVVLAEGRLSRLVGGVLVAVDELPDLTGARHPAVLGEDVAVLVADRTALQRLRVGEDAPPPLLLGAELTPPSIDLFGWAWTTPAACTGRVSAVGDDGVTVADVEASWLAGRRVVGLRLAADGARALVTSTGQAGQPDAVRVDVAGVRRAANGTPQLLSADVEVPPTPWLSQVLAAVWVGPTSVAVLGTAVPGSGPVLGATQATQGSAGVAPTVWLLDGGRATDLGGPPAAAAPVGLAGGEGRQSLVVGGADGRVWPREGSRWLAMPLAVAAYDPAYPG